MQEETQYAPITIGDWLLTLFITMIPLVGFIMILVWAFKPNVNVSKANWAKAILIFTIILTVVFMLFGSALVAMLPPGGPELMGMPN
jgi:hypothetical protein